MNMTYSIIRKLQLEGAHRLDAEYYQPEYLNLISKIKSQKSKALGDLVLTIKHPAEIKRIYEDSGVPFLLTQNISPEIYVLQFEEKRFISQEAADRIPQNRLKIGDVVMTRTGANYGDAAVYLGEPEGLFASAHVLIIRLKEILGEFLATYLNSQTGRSLVKRGIYGTSQPEISPEYLKILLVPMPDKGTITESVKLVGATQKELENSKSLDSQAEDLLLEELGLKDFDVEDDLEGKQASYGAGLSYIVNFSEVKFTHRADAEYFQPKYDKLVERIKKYGARKLGELVSMKKGVEPGNEAYQEQGKLFIRVSSVSKNGITEKDQKYISDELYQKFKKDFEPKVGDILLTKDATPGIAYVLKEPVEGIISGGILRLRIKENVDPEYLALYINSMAGQSQVKRDAGGAIIVHWKPEQVKNMLIPILPKPIQQKIADSVQKSHEARTKAKQLLEQAKQKVESLIEK